MLAVKTFSAESLHIHGYSVSRFHVGNLLPYFLYNSYHLMANSNPRYSSRHRTMLDVKIAGTDTAQRNSYDGIMLIYYRRLLFFCEAKLSLLDICKCFHLKLYISIIIHVLSCCEVTKNISIIQEKIQNLSHLLTCQLKKRSIFLQV